MKGKQPPHDREQDGFSERALGAKSKVVEEDGRWVVYLAVDFWEPQPGGETVDGRSANQDEAWPIETVWRRIADYPDRARAEVAARWIERSADRNLPRPPTGL
ncbi:MAG: hypothetical protein AAGF97_05040 [Planctomycetota bacterium]